MVHTLRHVLARLKTRIARIAPAEVEDWHWVTHGREPTEDGAPVQWRQRFDDVVVSKEPLHRMVWDYATEFHEGCARFPIGFHE